MWFEIIPSFAIVCTLLTIPIYTNTLLQKLALGTWYQRSTRNLRDTRALLWDERITGSTYVQQGLEALPDKPLNKPFST